MQHKTTVAANSQAIFCFHAISEHFAIRIHVEPPDSFMFTNTYLTATRVCFKEWHNHARAIPYLLARFKICLISNRRKMKRRGTLLTRLSHNHKSFVGKKGRLIFSWRDYVHKLLRLFIIALICRMEQ